MGKPAVEINGPFREQFYVDPYAQDIFVPNYEEIGENIGEWEVKICRTYLVCRSTVPSIHRKKDYSVFLLNELLPANQNEITLAGKTFHLWTSETFLWNHRSRKFTRAALTSQTPAPAVIKLVRYTKLLSAFKWASRRTDGGQIIRPCPPPNPNRIIEDEPIAVTMFRLEISP